MLLHGVRRTRLDRGPYDGEVGETLLPAPTGLAVGPDGGFIYTQHGEDDDGTLVYRYSPDLSPLHGAIVEADRQAIRQVAEERGVSVADVIAGLVAARKAAPTRKHPADALMEEADRLGVTPESLLLERGLLITPDGGTS